jgi:hypothetical protein
MASLWTKPDAANVIRLLYNANSDVAVNTREWMRGNNGAKNDVYGLRWRTKGPISYMQQVRDIKNVTCENVTCLQRSLNWLKLKRQRTSQCDGIKYSCIFAAKATQTFSPTSSQSHWWIPSACVTVRFAITGTHDLQVAAVAATVTVAVAESKNCRLAGETSTLCCTPIVAKLAWDRPTD